LMRLSRGQTVNDRRPTADPLFISAAVAYRERVMGIVLTGGVGDGAFGLRVIQAYGGLSVVQQPEEGAAPSMPYAAFLQDHPAACLSVEGIARRMAAFCFHGRTLPSRVYH
jgi:two-component system, chemotaxis family, protein-glutamate methylesterase/glutaminase